MLIRISAFLLERYGDKPSCPRRGGCYRSLVETLCSDDGPRGGASSSSSSTDENRKTKRKSNVRSLTDHSAPPPSRKSNVRSLTEHRLTVARGVSSCPRFPSTVGLEHDGGPDDAPEHRLRGAKTELYLIFVRVFGPVLAVLAHHARFRVENLFPKLNMYVLLLAESKEGEAAEGVACGEEADHVLARGSSMWSGQ